MCLIFYVRQHLFTFDPFPQIHIRLGNQILPGSFLNSLHCFLLNFGYRLHIKRKREVTDLINTLSLWNVHYICNKGRPLASDVGHMFCCFYINLHPHNPECEATHTTRPVRICAHQQVFPSVTHKKRAALMWSIILLLLPSISSFFTKKKKRLGTVWIV